MRLNQRETEVSGRALEEIRVVTLVGPSGPLGVGEVDEAFFEGGDGVWLCGHGCADENVVCVEDGRDSWSAVVGIVLQTVVQSRSSGKSPRVVDFELVGDGGEDRDGSDGGFHGEKVLPSCDSDALPRIGRGADVDV